MRVLVVVFALFAGVSTAHAQTPTSTDPVLVRQVEPNYTVEALRAGLRGKVELEAVVRANGTVGDIRITRSLDSTTGLDESAVKAARMWLFKPATVNGQPVDKTVSLELIFNLRGSPQEAVGVPADDPFAQGAQRLGAPGLNGPHSIYTPGWPATARDREAGPVEEVDLIVGADGSVLRARKARLPGAPASAADETLARALREWRFAPGSLNGPVPVLIRVAFVLPKGGVISESGVTQPVVQTMVQPKFTAVADRVRGTIELEVIVLADGTVGEVRVKKPTDLPPDLLEEAVRAAKQWRFKPATRAGEKVPVIAIIELKIPTSGKS